MKLYLISQDVNNGYDTFDSAVVAAKTEEDARKIEIGMVSEYFSEWCKPEHVKVKLIGEASSGIPEGIILASFNAG